MNRRKAKVIFGIALASTVGLSLLCAGTHARSAIFCGNSFLLQADRGHVLLAFGDVGYHGPAGSTDFEIRGPGSDKDLPPFPGIEVFPSGLRIHLYWPILALSALALLQYRQFRRARTSPHLCPTCQYDCRATPARCPECGAAVAFDDATSAGIPPLERARHDTLSPHSGNWGEP